MEALSYQDAAPIDSQVAWDELNEWLPQMLERLLDCEPHGPANLPPASGRGIYLFSEGDRNLYVGRTGITARSRAAGKDPSTSFLNRWLQHTSDTSPPNSAPFAIKLTNELADLCQVERPGVFKKRFKLQRAADWWTKLRNLDEPPDYYWVFQEAKRFIREELEFRCCAFDDDVRGVRSHVAEVYADSMLQADYGDFSTS